VKKGELVAELNKFPDDWEVMVNYERIVIVEPIEGSTSDGPGTLNILGDGA
jgi:hypothetical protein